CLRASGARSLVRSRQVRGPLRVNPNPSGSRSWEARALYPHDAEALPGRCLHYDPALQAIHHRRAKLFDAPHFGRNIVGLNVDVCAALMLDLLDFDDLQDRRLAPGVGSTGTNFRRERFGVSRGCVHSQIKSGVALWQIRTNLASYSPTDFGPMAHASRS